MSIIFKSALQRTLERVRARTDLHFRQRIGLALSLQLICRNRESMVRLAYLAEQATASAPDEAIHVHVDCRFDLLQQPILLVHVLHIKTAKSHGLHSVLHE